MGERCLDECCLRDYGISEDFVMQVLSSATCTAAAACRAYAEVLGACCAGGWLCGESTPAWQALCGGKARVVLAAWHERATTMHSVFFCF